MENLLLIKAIMTGDYSIFLRKLLIVLICNVIIIVASGFDFYTALRKAKVCKERIYSGGLRKTIKKDIEYILFCYLMFLLDILASIWVDFPFFIMISTAGVVLIEAYSVLENLRAMKSNAANIPMRVKEILENKDEINKLINLIDGASNSGNTESNVNNEIKKIDEPI